MIIYNIFKLIIKLFLAALFLGIIALAVYLAVQGADWTAFTGEVWYNHHPYSLGLAQVVVERYIYHPLWFNVIVPYVLQQPAYITFPCAFIGIGFLGYSAKRLF